MSNNNRQKYQKRKKTEFKDEWNDFEEKKVFHHIIVDI